MIEWTIELIQKSEDSIYIMAIHHHVILMFPADLGSLNCIKIPVHLPVHIFNCSCKLKVSSIFISCYPNYRNEFCRLNALQIMLLWNFGISPRVWQTWLFTFGHTYWDKSSAWGRLSSSSEDLDACHKSILDFEILK